LLLALFHFRMLLEKFNFTQKFCYETTNSGVALPIQLYSNILLFSHYNKINLARTKLSRSVCYVTKPKSFIFACASNLKSWVCANNLFY
jgi:hypothetical protein